MANNIQKLAKEYLGYFEVATRQDGTQYWRRKDSAPEEVRELCLALTKNYETDDWRYILLIQSLKNIAKSKSKKYSMYRTIGELEIIDMAMQWLYSNKSRFDYINDAIHYEMADIDIEDFVNELMEAEYGIGNYVIEGMSCELREVIQIVNNYLGNVKAKNIK